MLGNVPLVRHSGRAALPAAAAPLPRPVRFWDGVSRRSTEGVAQLFRLWQPAGVSVGDVAAPLCEAGYRSRDLDVSTEAVRPLWRPVP